MGCGGLGVGAAGGKGTCKKKSFVQKLICTWSSSRALLSSKVYLQVT